MANQRYWTAVLYPENMISTWESDIGDILQYPYAYCIHDCDTDSQSEHRKTHVHIILTFPNTTTYKHALSVFDRLSAPDKRAVNTCEGVISIRHCFDYLIHDTDTCRKKGKYLYPLECRVCGNNFDVGSYEQLSITDRKKILMQIANDICDNSFTNYRDFFDFFCVAYKDDFTAFEVLTSYTSFIKSLIEGNYHRNINSNV